jgi:hypothetical protein
MEETMAHPIDPENTASERKLRVHELEIKKREIQAQMREVQALTTLSQLREQLVAVEKEIKRLR